MTENQTSKATKSTTRNCKCGCGQQTSSSKTAYKPGHDARHAGSVARDFAAYLADGGKDTTHSMLDELGSDKLRAKAVAMAERLLAKATKTPQDRKPSRAAAADQKAADALEGQTEGSKRVGQWLDETIVAIEEKQYELDQAAAVPEPMWEETYPVKIGRWTYPTRQSTTGTQERNTKRDGSGEWVAYEG